MAGVVLEGTPREQLQNVATNYISPTDDPAFTASFGLQFDHPDGFAGQAPLPEAATATRCSPTVGTCCSRTTTFSRSRSTR
jgi:hypothetical protein